MRRPTARTALLVLGVTLLGSAMSNDREQAVILLSLSFGVCERMLPCAFALCLDVGGGLGGAVSGAMNTAGQAGVFCGTVLFGDLVQRYSGSLGAQAAYQLPLYAIAAMILFSGLLFVLIDPNRPLLAGVELRPAEKDA